MATIRLILNSRIHVALLQIRIKASMFTIETHTLLNPTMVRKKDHLHNSRKWRRGILSKVSNR